MNIYCDLKKIGKLFIWSVLSVVAQVFLVLAKAEVAVEVNAVEVKAVKEKIVREGGRTLAAFTPYSFLYFSVSKDTLLKQHIYVHSEVTSNLCHFSDVVVQASAVSLVLSVKFWNLRNNTTYQQRSVFDYSDFYLPLHWFY